MEHLEHLEAPPMTGHANRRLAQRAITGKAVKAAMLEGRVILSHGGRKIFFLGDNEVRKARSQGMDLKPYRNVMVVMAPCGTILTVVKTKHVPKGRTLLS